MKVKRYFFDGTEIPAGPPYNRRFTVISKVLTESEVYFCRDNHFNREVVLKAEEIGCRDISSLERESYFYEKLSEDQYFDIVIEKFSGINHRFLVLKKRGIDLQKYYKKQIKAGLWTDRHLNEYAVQMIGGLQKCHSFGIIHLDPKPNNYVLDANDEKTIYLIDFDCANHFLNKDGQHIPFRKDLPFRQIKGNRAYLSLNGHNREEQSRRDDMIFLGYSLIWMARGDLPWSVQKTSQSLSERYEFMKNQKNSIDLKELCVNRENQTLNYLVQYMEHCMKLEFTAEPDYSYLISLFETKASVDTEGYSLC